MADDLIFYTNPMSRGRIARWMLEEIGEPYQTEIIFYGDAMKSAGYRAINPMGKVPALRHGDTIITETAAICAHLADAFPEAGLAPPSGHRGQYYRWLFFGAGPFEAAVGDKALGIEIPDDRQPMMGYGTFDTMQTILKQAVAGKTYIAGSQFTAADVYMGGHIGFGLQFGTLEKCPELENYVARVNDRPAFRRANEIDDALMPSEV
ncbi:MAG: glutathione S-transferase family protein [Hyphomicrobiaceae bacterium]